MIGRAHIAEEAMKHREKLQLALDDDFNFYTFRDVVDLLLTGQATLWSDTDSAAVTIVQHHPRGKAYILWLAAGDLSQIMRMEPLIFCHARELGCKTVELHGRPGWAKALKKSGYTKEKVSMRTQLVKRVEDSDDGK